MSDIEEKRVYSDKVDRAVAYVASAVGVVRVTVSGAQVGRFGVVHRCTAAGVACDVRAVAVAADDAYRAEAGESDDPAFRATGFGPATAVGFVDEALLAGAGEAEAEAEGEGASESADPVDGRVARYDTDERAWEALGETGGVRAIDGGAVAAADGVYLAGDGLRHVGLSDVRDVAGGGTPFAATGDGLYRLGNGWMDELPGAFRAVAAAADGRVHAVTGDGGEIVVRGGGADGEGEGEGERGWTRVDPPTDEPVVDVVHAPDTTLAVTESGTLLAERESDWRAQALGLKGVTELAVRG